MSKPQSPFPVQLRLTGSELLYALELIAPDAFKVGFDRQHPQLMGVIVIAGTAVPSKDFWSAAHEWKMSAGAVLPARADNLRDRHSS
ncbi:hypothetical protein AWB69_02070 [Caballeronia udeis]|uniref:Uncharacterized protein n=1 Tax=Caballeronia udeis TaxID=1232866 RepID=A0A158G5N2_9BURK|nr:hypothetical protein [Caballeronia udeis]SAL27203.1 hypothetical protein AWB69_02070 [Caballeronia udeis]